MTIHIIGAGLAGLAAAVALAEGGDELVLHEATGQAGGRCRSFFDERLGCRIDNGNHLLLSGNDSALAYLRTVHAVDELWCAPEAAFPFIDLATDERWCVRPNDGPLPYWLFDGSRRTAGTSARENLALLRLLHAPPRASIGERIDVRSKLYRDLIEPLVVAVCNTPAEEASAALFARTLRETLLRGGRFCRPMIARRGLSETFVDPALRWLRKRPVTIAMNSRLRRIERHGERATALRFTDRTVALEAHDRVVLATPPAMTANLLPDLRLPSRSTAILNLHFRLDRPAPEVPLLGLLRGTAQWLFCRGPLVSVTVSAADALIDRPTSELASTMWEEVRRALSLENEALPPWRVVKEKRATFEQTPHEVALRPAADAAGLANLVLAGDWTDTGLPATIEGAIRSGGKAALLLEPRRRGPAAVSPLSWTRIRL